MADMVVVSAFAKALKALCEWLSCACEKEDHHTHTHLVLSSIRCRISLHRDHLNVDFSLKLPT